MFNYSKIYLLELRFINISMFQVLNSEFSNQYYLIKGEVGTGKTRLIVETVREMIKQQNATREGAPVYVAVAQGKSFPDSLAEAVGFLYDEHINFRSLLDLVFHTQSMPARDDVHKLRRVLNAIELSAFRYMMKTGRPVVLVVDGVNSLPTSMPDALQILQEKAKLWADTNIAKVIFVSNDEETEKVLKQSSSSWSRAAAPLCVGDLTQEEVKEYLGLKEFMESSTKNDKQKIAHQMPIELVQKIYQSVGGKIHFLIQCKRDWYLSIPFEETLSKLKAKELAKFAHIAKSVELMKVVQCMHRSPTKSISLSSLIAITSPINIELMTSENIIRYERQQTNVIVKFESRLTEVVVDELMG